MASSIIEVDQLTKTFKGDVQAVKGVSFFVKEGEFFAFLGPNGAGKSTTVQMITTLLKPTSGVAKVAGYDVDRQPERIREQIGVALQETGIDPGLTGRELLEMQARLFGFKTKDANKRANELLELVGLTGDADRRCGKYSGGMRRRLDLALTLVQKPKILFLDEPTTGLDPANRKIIWDEIRYLNKEIGTTIFLTTQYLEEADQLADRISIINKGEIVASGTSEELKRSVGKDVVELSFSNAEETRRAAGCLSDLAEDTETLDLQLKMYLANGTSRLSDIVRRLDQELISPVNLNVAPPTLDDVFLKVTGTQFEENNEKRRAVL
ncbi:MAG TPA: ATP-binding cassette domain-containing protein [Bacillales bacterium]|nr:ATP-binding cassette domain-containing protein [Bacillales bacterium]